MLCDKNPEKTKKVPRIFEMIMKVEGLIKNLWKSLGQYLTDELSTTNRLDKI
jgi:hypothetical protein